MPIPLLRPSRAGAHICRRRWRCRRPPAPVAGARRVCGSTSLIKLKRHPPPRSTMAH